MTKELIDAFKLVAEFGRLQAIQREAGAIIFDNPNSSVFIVVSDQPQVKQKILAALGGLSESHT